MGYPGPMLASTQPALEVTLGSSRGQWQSLGSCNKAGVQSQEQPGLHWAGLCPIPSCPGCLSYSQSPGCWTSLPPTSRPLQTYCRLALSPTDPKSPTELRTQDDAHLLLQSRPVRLGPWVQAKDRGEPRGPHLTLQLPWHDSPSGPQSQEVMGGSPGQ